MKLTEIQKAAFEKVGRKRKSPARIGKDLTTRTFKNLAKKGLVMRYGDKVMFTLKGEQLWTQLHPNSKYRIS